MSIYFGNNESLIRVLCLCPILHGFHTDNFWT